jgi:ThiF family protein
MQTYFMVGAGGTGTHLLPALLTYLRAHHGIDKYQVVIADGDIFETKNQARQLFAQGLIATNKAEAMVRMYEGHPLIAVSRYIGAADIETMVQDGDCVLICADNYSVRALIADRAQALDNVTVVNGGNEYNDGTVQLWVRENGENMTPNIRYGHPEITYIADDDRAPMTCAQAAELPGGEQTILANMKSATFMLEAVQRWHSGLWRGGWTELVFEPNQVQLIDMRERKNWQVNP